MDAVLNSGWAGAVVELSPLIALLIAAAAAALSAAFSKEKSAPLEQAFALAGLAAAILLSWRLWPAAELQPGGALALDRIALAAIMTVCVSAAFAMLMAQSSLSAMKADRPGFHALAALAAFGMCALASGRDLIAILIAMECASLALYAMAAFMRDRPQCVEGSLKFFIMNAFATAFFCMGAAFIFGSLGSTDLALIAERFEFVASGDGRGVFLFGLAMVSIGLAFKVSAAPFHFWAPDALDGSPTPVSLLFAVCMKAAAVVAFWRLAQAIAAPGGALWHHLTWAIAAVTMIWGSVAALTQDGLKRMLAYASVAHSGFLLMVFPSLAVSPAESARALMAGLGAYAFSMSGALAVTSALEAGLGEGADMHSLCGLSRRRPWIAAALALFLLSLAGVPPTLGFFGRYSLFIASSGAGDISLVAVAVAASVVMFACFVRPLAAIYIRREPASAGTREAGGLAMPSRLIAVILLAAMAVVIFGILPQNFAAFVAASAF